MISKEELLSLQNNEDIQLTSVRHTAYLIQFIHNPSEEVQLVAVKQDGYSIQYVNNPSEEVQLVAVKQNGYSIRFIYNPSKYVQLKAIKQNVYSIQHINNLSFDVCDEALNSCENQEELDRIIKRIDIEKYPELYEKYCFMSV